MQTIDGAPYLILTRVWTVRKTKIYGFRDDEAFQHSTGRPSGTHVYCLTKE